MSVNNSEVPTEKLSREFKSLLNTAKESKIISACVAIDDRARKSRKDIYETSLQTSPGDGVINRSRTSSDNSTSSDVSQKTDGKRSMRSQNAEFVLKHRKFLNTLTGRTSPELLVDDTGKEISKDDQANMNLVDKSGRRVDPFCWHCHKTGSQMFCSICIRTYHTKCLSPKASPMSPGSPWACPECVISMNADNTDNRSPIMRRLTVNKLSILLKFALEKMAAVPGSTPFEEEVDLDLFPQYVKCIANPMNLKKLRHNIAAGGYGSTEAFLADAKWIVHNSVIFNSVQAKLTSAAKSILKVCRTEMYEINICHECYYAANTRQDWFVQICSKPHVLLWAKLKGFPYWPAKAMAISTAGQVDVRFFGAHDRAWLNPRDCYLYSIKDPNLNNKQRKNEILVSLQELQEHVNKLSAKYGTFRPAAFKTPYSTHSEEVFLKMMLPNYIPDETVNAKIIFPSSIGESKSSGITKNKKSSPQPKNSTESDLQPNMMTAFSKKLNRTVFTEGYHVESGASTSKLLERKNSDPDEQEFEVGEVISTYTRKGLPQRGRSKSSTRKNEDSEKKKAALKRTKRSQSVCVAFSQILDEDISTSDILDDSSIHSERLVLEIPMDDEPPEASNKRKRTLSEDNNANKKSKEAKEETEVPPNSEIINRRMSMDSKLMMCYRKALANKSSESASIDVANHENTKLTDNEGLPPNRGEEDANVNLPENNESAMECSHIPQSDENEKQPSPPNITPIQSPNASTPIIPNGSAMVRLEIMNQNLSTPIIIPKKRLMSNLQENPIKKSPPKKCDNTTNVSQFEIIPKAIDSSNPCDTNSINHNQGTDTAILPSSGPVSDTTLLEKPRNILENNRESLENIANEPNKDCTNPKMSLPCESAQDSCEIHSSESIANEPKVDCSNQKISLQASEKAQKSVNEHIPSEQKLPNECAGKINIELPNECASKINIDFPFETVEAVTNKKSVTGIENNHNFVNGLSFIPSETINQNQSVCQSGPLLNMNNPLMNGHTSTVADTTIKRITLNKSIKNKSPEKTNKDSTTEESPKSSSPEKYIVNKSNLITKESVAGIMKQLPNLKVLNVNDKRKSVPVPSIVKKTKIDVAKKPIPTKVMPLQGKRIRIMNSDLTQISGLNTQISNINKNNINNLINYPKQNVNTNLCAMNSMVFIPTESTQHSNNPQDNIQPASNRSSSTNGPTMTFSSLTSLALGNGTSSIVGRPMQSLLADKATGNNKSQASPSSSTNTNSVRVVPSAFLLNPFSTASPINSDSIPPRDNSRVPGSAGPVSKMLEDMSFKVMEEFYHSMSEAMKSEAENNNLVAINRLLHMEFEKISFTYKKKLLEMQKQTDKRISEIQTCYELDKAKTVEELRKQADIEKLKAIRETKKKTWCSYCPREAELYCCMNTAYCELTCQKAHWPEHIGVCQNKNTTQASGDTLPTLGNLVTTNTVRNRKNIIIKSVGNLSSAGLFKTSGNTLTTSSIRPKSPGYKLVVSPVMTNGPIGNTGSASPAMTNSPIGNTGSTTMPTVNLSQPVSNHDEAQKKNVSLGDIPPKT